MKGFRHILQGETQRDFMLRPTFKKGISLLKRHNFTYDILIFPDQLQFSYEFVKAFPEQPFVLDHIGKPYIKDGKIDGWKNDIQRLASCRNVFCKVSGMVTETNWCTWKNGDFFPYLDVVTEAFGTERIMFGSDWPVCLVAAEYGDVVSIVNQYYGAFSQDEQEDIFGGNAIRFYNL
jgi:L-fuconolactonase